MRYTWICLALVLIPFIYCNNEPLIGILTKPIDEEYEMYKEYKEVVEAKYVHFIEGGGGRAVAISYKWDRDTLKNAMKKINGMLFVGGGVDLVNGKKLTEYSQGAKRVMDIAKEFNAAGDYFPVWGTCLGFELILILESFNTTLLQPCRCKNYNVNLFYNEATKNDNRLFKTGFSEYLLDIMNKKNVTYNNHQWMVDDAAFNDDLDLRRNYKILARSPWKDAADRSKLYIAAVEHNKYPIYAVQFHPEKYNYEYNFKQPVERSRESITVSHGFANFFSNEARKSKHEFSSIQELLNSLVQKTSIPVFNAQYGYLYCYKSVPYI